MTTYRLDENETKLPKGAQAGDVLVFGSDAYRLYIDPQRGLRMARHNGSVESDHEARRRELADLDATMDAASNRWGY